MDLLDLHKKVGDKLTAEELNTIGQAIDNNTRRLTDLIATAGAEIARLNQAISDLQRQINDIVDPGGGGGGDMPDVLYGGHANTMFEEVLYGGHANTVFSAENILYGKNAKLN